jgi:hypothetical protein
MILNLFVDVINFEKTLLIVRARVCEQRIKKKLWNLKQIQDRLIYPNCCTGQHFGFIGVLLLFSSLGTHNIADGNNANRENSDGDGTSVGKT